jgi:hypothetical protein
MSAPKFTPVSPIGAFRDGGGLPPAQAWTASRPAEISGRQPTGTRLGSPGPDQGYALTLARRFHGQLSLTEGENEHDVIAGCLTIALKRAALFGRAPVIHDLRRAFEIFGFTGDPAPDDLVAFRRSLFQAAGHHYELQRTIADLVPEVTLRSGQVRIDMALRAGRWRELLAMGAVPNSAPLS